MTARDIQMFKMAHEQRFVIYHQLKRAFWPDRSDRANACYKRITRLVNEGYFTIERTDMKKRLSIYLITQKAHAELKACGEDSTLPLYTRTGDFERSLNHDLNVNSIRILFREFGLDQWTSERVLKERDHVAWHVPDGVLNVHGRRIAVEFENFLKGRRRYEELFRSYKKGGRYYLVFMILREDLRDWLFEMDYNAQQVWFLNYNDLMKYRRLAFLENKRGRRPLERILK